MGLVGPGDRRHEVAVPRPQRHAPDRHRHTPATATAGTIGDHPTTLVPDVWRSGLTRGRARAGRPWDWRGAPCRGEAEPGCGDGGTARQWSGCGRRASASVGAPRSRLASRPREGTWHGCSPDRRSSTRTPAGGAAGRGALRAVTSAERHRRRRRLGSMRLNVMSRPRSTTSSGSRATSGPPADSDSGHDPAANQADARGRRPGQPKRLKRSCYPPNGPSRDQSPANAEVTS